MSKLADNFVQLFPQFDPFALVLANLALEVMPFGFFLLKLSLKRFFFFFHFFVLFKEPIDGSFELRNVVHWHGQSPKNFMFEFSFYPVPCQANVTAGGQ
ncbi:MAG TPA: hypothetical protein VNM15_04845 [Candidatus Binatia bacterium]|nr:hypothetical protein [Candidatus Binatia bacterium]